MGITLFLDNIRIRELKKQKEAELLKKVEAENKEKTES